jgi:hypothetical protein
MLSGGSSMAGITTCPNSTYLHSSSSKSVLVFIYVRTQSKQHQRLRRGNAWGWPPSEDGFQRRRYAPGD